MSWLPPVVTVAPASEPLTQAEAKNHLKVDGSDDNDAIDRLISTGRTLVEEITGTKLASQTVVMRCSDWSDLSKLPIAPIVSVSSVTYLDSAGATQTLSTDVYEGVLHGLEPHIRLKLNQSWPSVRDASDAITVTAVAGYASLPAPVKSAMLLTIAALYDGRSEGSIPKGAMDLLDTNYRRF
jgi:uncharacterized phiE125 gp8 family phage protein